MLNKVAGPVLREPPARPRFRFRPQPVAVFPWVFPVVVFLYALPHAGPFPAPGQVIRSHYPAVVEAAKALLASYWFLAAAHLAYRLARAPRETYGRWVQIVLSALLLGFALSYGLVRLHREAVDNIALPAALLCGVLAFLAALPVSRRLPRSPVIALVASLVVVLPLGYVDMPNMWGGWRDMASLGLPDGRLYHLQHWGVLQGQTDALTEEVSRGPLFLRTRVIGAVGEGSEIGLTRLPMPLGRPLDWQGQLLLTPDARWVLYLRRAGYDPPGSSRVALAYDRRTSRLYSSGNLSSTLGASQAPEWADVAKRLEGG